MIQELKATYANGVFEPATPVNLDEGTKVVISVTEETQSRTDSDRPRIKCRRMDRHR